MSHYSHHELTVLAKKKFREIQRSTSNGGLITDYKYRGWQILVNGGQTVLLMSYDVGQRPIIGLENTSPLKLSHAIQL